MLVTRMSRLDISSPEITYLLQDLAPLVLCRRWHQNQAFDIVDDWQEEVDALRREKEAARRAEEEERRQDRRLRSAEERRVREAAQRAEELRHQQEVAQQADEVQQTQEATPRVGEACSEQEAVHGIEIQQLRAELALMRARLEEVEDRNRELHRRTRSEQPERGPSGAVDQDADSDTDVLVTVPISASSTSDQRGAEEPVFPVPAPVERVEEDHTSPTISPSDHLPEEPEESDNRTMEGDCSICLESFGSQNNLTRCTAQCGQHFHLDCIGIWLVSAENTHTCPYW